MAHELSAMCQDSFLASDWMKGLDLYFNRKVVVSEVGPGGAVATVNGDHYYQVLLDFRKTREGVIGCSCTCPRFAKGTMCEHIFALFVKIELPKEVSLGDRIAMKVIPIDPSAFQGTGLEQANNGVGTAGKGIKLFEKRKSERDSIWRKQLGNLENRSRRLQSRSIKPIDVLKGSSYWYEIAVADLGLSGKFAIRIFESGIKLDGGPTVPRLVSYEAFQASASQSKDDVTIVESLFLEKPLNYAYGGSSFVRFSRPRIRNNLRDLAATGRFVLSQNSGEYLHDFKPLIYDAGNDWRLILDFQEIEGDNVRVSPLLCRDDQNGVIEQRKISEAIGPCWTGAIVFGQSIGVIREEDLPRVLVWRDAPEIIVPKEDLPDFMKRLAQSSVAPELRLQPSLGIEVVPGVPKPKLTLKSPTRLADKFLLAEIDFQYGEAYLVFGSDTSFAWDAENSRLIARDREIELKRFDDLRPFRFEEHHIDSYSKDLSVKRSKLPSMVSTLVELGWDVEAEGKRLRRAGDFNIKVTSGQDWFDVNAKFEFDGGSIGLPELLDALRRGEKTIKLGDGTYGVLPEEWLKKFGGLEQLGEVVDGGIRVKSQQALMLDMMLAEQSNISFDATFTQLCQKLRNFSGIKPKNEPASFQGTLRDYQRDGLAWFEFLRELKFGGCLADDMGLGKTIQILALLEERRVRKLKKGEKRKPSIAIVPKSLVFNWIEEAKRFTPKLKVVDYTGKDRSSRLDEIQKADLVLTTYATFRLDVVELCQIEFDYAILDEAQAVKNATAQASKAVRLLKSDYRLAMSGTPVENHLGDLWTLFDFLNPGMLGDTVAKTFTFEDGDQAKRIAALGRALKPFILRRTKEQVLTELPEKTEQTLYCEMSPKQKKLYDQLKNHYRASLSTKIKADGMNKSKIQVLEALLRLRQASCDPRLIDAEQKVVGAKIELLVEQIEEALAENHKALIFSQFTSLLALVRKAFDAKGWNYEYLDGQSNRRAESVKRFQEDAECPLFLISLKAGGHGLNLTAADYVFILDPWWNPAAEAQAIDRAHRMGQKKSVVAYRVITKDTVEEKIVALQNSKRELADAIVSADEGLIRTLSFEDLQVLFE